MTKLGENAPLRHSSPSDINLQIKRRRSSGLAERRARQTRQPVAGRPHRGADALGLRTKEARRAGRNVPCRDTRVRRPSRASTPGQPLTAAGADRPGGSGSDHHLAARVGSKRSLMRLALRHTPDRGRKVGRRHRLRLCGGIGWGEGTGRRGVGIGDRSRDCMQQERTPYGVRINSI